jgi:hypothetical protein
MPFQHNILNIFQDTCEKYLMMGWNILPHGSLGFRV